MTCDRNANSDSAFSGGSSRAPIGRGCLEAAMAQAAWGPGRSLESHLAHLPSHMQSTAWEVPAPSEHLLLVVSLFEVALPAEEKSLGMGRHAECYLGPWS